MVNEDCETSGSNDAAGQKTHFEHADRLFGSVDVTTDSTGAVVSGTGWSFDAFGKRRDPSTWIPPQAAAQVAADRAVTHRGYTNHEMLDNVGLVHTNGRVYDPQLGRFLSVDPVFQFPTNTQSLNPYSYVLNNPLSLTDPTGYASAGSNDSNNCDAGGSTSCNGTLDSEAMTGTRIKGVDTGVLSARPP